MAKAVFFDRDGVLNRLVCDPATQDWTSPHEVRDLQVGTQTAPGLLALQDAGFQLFVVSNQPSYAKGKTTLAKLQAIQAEFERQLRVSGVRLTESFICYHHPQGVVPGYAVECECRKPKPYFLRLAERKYGLDLAASWLIGDRDMDIQCGHAAGVRTIQIASEQTPGAPSDVRPEYTAADLAAAVRIILRPHGGHA
jgi:D-glycero-D-manno-heptose 1,7-bisphosphate phosphatase